jgi:glucan 1,3-beta-glucosidase
MPNWIRGVNIGGWLVLERFITPYLFAITTCHLSGNFCYHPGQIGRMTGYTTTTTKECDWKVCKPVLQKNSISGEMEFPRDKVSLMQQFDDPLIASKFLDLHYQHFVTRQDINDLKEAGVTHVRVPLSPSIVTSSSPPEEEVADDNDNAWLYFLRLVGWCRQDGIQVWPDLHIQTSTSWNVNHTLDAVRTISREIVKDGLGDVVTGFGIFNPQPNNMDLYDMQVVRDYASKALYIVRSTLGNDTAIIMGDMDNSTMWNDGWWVDKPNTHLDSHYNQGTKQNECWSGWLVVVTFAIL